jgi:hypothetical protein
MNRRVVGTAGIPAGVLRADCHAGKDAGGPRFMGREHLQNPAVSSVHARWLRAVRADKS